MKAVILSAGLSIRMREIKGIDEQKTMIKYSEKPLLQRNIEIIRDNGIKDIIIVVNYMKNVIKNYFGNGEKFNVNIEYVEQENPKKGTANAVLCVESKINNNFLLIYGDNVFDSKIISNILKINDCDGVLCVKNLENPKNFGVIKTDGENVKEIIEKPEKIISNLALTGIFILPIEIFESIKKTKISKRGEYELPESIQILINEGFKFKFIEIDNYWFDPRNEEEINEINLLLKLNH